MQLLNGQHDRSFQRTAWLVSAGGLVPFAGIVALLLIARHDNPLHALLVDGLRIYSAIVLSFLGGIRWGIFYSARTETGRVLVLAVLPALIALIAMFLPPAPSVAVLLFAFCALGAWDSLALYWRPELSGFARLRVVMTLFTAAALFVALFVV